MKNLLFAIIIFTASIQIVWSEENDHGLSFRFDMAINTNLIAVGYQDFSSMGMNTNFQIKGSPELSSFHEFVGISGIYSMSNFAGIIRLSLDNRSGYIQDDNFSNSDYMNPSVYYASLDALVNFPITRQLHCYVGPSISYLLDASIGAINSNRNEAPIPSMNTIVPGGLLGISHSLKSVQLSDFSFECSPFLEVAWIANQRKGEFSVNQDQWDNIWSTLTFRTGFHINLNPIKNMDSSITLRIETPNELTGKRSATELFPLIPKIYFDDNSTIIPERYVQLDSLKALAFHESHCDYSSDFSDIAHQAKKRLFTYYHILPIIGKRMILSKDTLIVRSHHVDSQIALKRASVIRDYLISVFSIEPNRFVMRIDTLIKEDFVAFENASILNPVKLSYSSIDPIENFLYCSLNDHSQNIESWKLRVMNSGSMIKEYGPFYGKSALINSTELFSGNTNDSVFIAQCILKLNNGKKHSIQQNFSLPISKEDKMRSSIVTLFEQDVNDSTLIESQIRELMESKTDKALHEVILIGNGVISKSEQADNLIETLNKSFYRNKIGIKNIKYYQNNDSSFFSKYSMEYPEGKAYSQSYRIEIIH